MMSKARLISVAKGVVCLLVVGSVLAREPAWAQQVSLPHAMSDARGNNWTIYPGGWVQIKGDMPVYSQGAVLTINGAQPTTRNNQGTLDPKTGELVLEGMSVNALGITRRIKTDVDGGYVRYVDVLSNPTGQEQTVQVRLQTNLNFGVRSSKTIPDPRRKDQSIGWAAMTHGNRAAVELYAGKGAKLAPTISAMNNANRVQASFDLSVPAGGSIALMHLHATADSQEAGEEMILGIKDQQLVKELSPTLRRQLVNFPRGQDLIGDYELLRGDLFDVVELRGGDQVRGTIQRSGYTLDTFYGRVELPVERVVGLMNIGAFRPRQLLVTTDGEIFGGLLEGETIDLRLSSGQVTRIPLNQVSRMGYRKRDGEPEEWSLDRPMVLLRSGDRVGIVPPDDPIAFATRYGTLELEAMSIASIIFASADSAVHQLRLTDGSRVAGLAEGEGFSVQLSGTRSEQAVTFPASTIARINFGKDVEGPDADAPTVELVNDDLLVGALVGQLKLNTAFDTLEINAPEIRRLTHLEASPLDIQVTLWDNTTVSGQVDAPSVSCRLTSGLVVELPVGLIRGYNQALPSPSAETVQRIHELVGKLGDDDWKRRDQAEAELASLGVAVVGVLKAIRPGQPPEAQQRIDAIVQQIDKERGARR